MLLLPVFFMAGWLTNDSDDNSRYNQNTESTGAPTYGVGGGPGDNKISPRNQDEFNNRMEK
ncbi:MAG: hypothetical protein M3P33_04560, partial [bacterium]|nr:hypothetical protein [bacterium]